MEGIKANKKSLKMQKFKREKDTANVYNVGKVYLLKM
jgi:hypothetical protein